MRKRKLFLGLTAVGACVAAAMIGARQADDEPGKLLVLEWAKKSSMPTPPAAVLIELGTDDDSPTDWSGTANVQGAVVKHREGYRFRPGTGDKLVEPNGWTAKSHRALRAPARNPAINKLEGISTVGVVLHLDIVEKQARLTVTPTAQDLGKATVMLDDVLTGKPQPIWGGKGTVRLVTTAMPLATGDTEDDFPAACYGPDGTLWVAWQAYHLRDKSRMIEQQALKEIPEDFDFLDHPGFADQLFVKAFKDGEWGKPIAVTDAEQDLVGSSLVPDDEGVRVAYSAFQDGRHGSFVRLLGPDGTVTPVSESPSKTAEVRPSSGHFFIPGRGWGGESLTAVVPDPTLVRDTHTRGDSDIEASIWVNKIEEVHPIARSDKFEARPSCCYDLEGRLWIAYEEGPPLWGKDYGALDDSDGSPLYSARSVRVVCLVGDKLMRPVAELPTSQVEAPKYPYVGGSDGRRFERNSDRYAYPKIGIDGKGRVWLTYRQKFGSRYSTHPGSYWLTFARRFDGDRWSEPIEVHHSCGLLDHRPVLLPHKSGGLLIVHNTDGRYTTPHRINNDIYLSYVNLPGGVTEPKLKPHDPGKKDPELVTRAEREAEAVERIRAHRIDHNGQKLRLLRGEYHRHTEISWDGGPDGSLEDMFRYAIDAAQFDWIGNGDHDNGAGREYPWWLTQKFTDAYHIPGKFTPMFTYERSVSYPHGHRNVMFARRGIMTLPRLAAEEDGEKVAGIHADDTKMLYKYLKQFDGICAVHTSATGMGTDWRDNDPEVEPIVEIYQGDRMSYEKFGAPRAGYDAKSEKSPINIGGWRPLGFVDLALRDKGYRLGFQASSDHWSTHISYFVVLAPENSRQAILDAVKKRHCYGATDDIICDVQCDGHIMGDAFETVKPPKLDVQVIGTGPLQSVEVLKDSEVVANLPVRGDEYNGSWTDPKPGAGEHYYYVRVLQENGEIAWTSPMWIKQKE